MLFRAYSCLRLIKYGLFPPNLKNSMTIFQKNIFINKFSCKCDACYIGRTSQRLDIRMNLHIPCHIFTATLNYSAMSSNQNPPSAIARHLLDNLASSTAYNPIMFSIIVSSSNELHLSILDGFLFTKYQPELYIQKHFYTLILFYQSL